MDEVVIGKEAGRRTEEPFEGRGVALAPLWGKAVYL